MNWFRKIFKKKEQNAYHVAYEKSDVVRVFDELEETALKKMRLKNYLEGFKKRKEELAIYEHLTEQERNQLALMMNRYKAIEEKKQHLRGRLIKTNKALLRLEAYEEQLPEILKEVSTTEKKVKEYERDLFYLGEEKENLEEERDILIKGYTFLKYCIIAFGILTIISVFLIFALLQVVRENILVYLSAILSLFIIGVLGIAYAKIRLEKNIQKNEILQKKAVKYINKSKIHLFHNRRYLDFYFDKLGVDSTAKLELYYNRYVKNKQNQDEYNKLNQQLMVIEFDVEGIFKAKGVEIGDIDNLKEWLLTAQRAKTFENLIKEEEKLQIQLKAFEAYEEDLWKEAYSLKEDPRYREKVKEKIEQYQILTKEHLDKKVQYA